MKKHSILALLVTLCAATLLLAGTLLGCSNAQDATLTRGDSSAQGALPSKSADTPAAYQKVSAKEAKQLMDNSTGYVIVDVRTQSEYQTKHITGAILLPVDDIASMAPSGLLDKDQVIFVYCRTGGRSAAAAQTLAGLGYTNVYDMGGINSWPYETTKG